jgi:DNA repair protein RecO (recombination protein O)
MIFKSLGIVFRTVKYSETSVIAEIYTQERGMRSYIISGVRTKQAKTSMSILQNMSIVDIVAYEREDKSINRLKEIKAGYVYQTLLYDVRKAAIGMFILELAKKTIKEREENGPLFSFIHDVFVELDTSEGGYYNMHLSFMLGLSVFLGFMPDSETKGELFDLQEGIFKNPPIGHQYWMNEELSGILRLLLGVDWRNSNQVILSREQRQQLLTELIGYYKLHIDGLKEINSHLILKEIF